MAQTTRECDELIELARTKGLTLGVAENTRFVEAYLEAERLLRAGGLGKPRLIRTLICGSAVVRLNDPTSWKSRAAGAIGGAIFDAAPHSIYLLKWLFGEIEHVRASMHKLVPASEVEDHGVLAGRLKCGTPFTTEYTFTAEIPWSERLEIYGSTASLIVDQLVDPPVRLFRGAADMEGQARAVAHDPAGWKRRSIAAGVAAFATAASREEPAPVDARDGRYAIDVIAKAYQSIEASGRPVEI
jgi:predicted dehydrogenase